MKTEEYGLGWAINRYGFLDSELHIEHTGTLKGGGFHSIIVAVPEKNLGVIVLSNTETFSHFSRDIVEGILKRLLEIDG
ncbi:MAG: serine hydrolase [Bacillota bacterium]